MMDEKAMVVKSLRRKDKFLINPLGPFTRQRIEWDLVGIITENNDDLGYRYKISFKGTPYGASIIKRVGSYGMENDDWELAVTYEGNLCFDSPITDDVLGWIDEEELLGILAQIRNLNNSPNGEIQ
jgi:hypothetical protein